MSGIERQATPISFHSCSRQVRVCTCLQHCKVDSEYLVFEELRVAAKLLVEQHPNVSEQRKPSLNDAVDKNEWKQGDGGAALAVAGER